MTRHAFGAELRARLAANLARHERARQARMGLKRAAVCVIVTGTAGGEAALLLTRRAAHLTTHAGQFALPGGRIDEGESPLEAARREALEEIGLALAPEAFLGRLDDYPTRSGFLITPLVAWLAAGAEPVANPDEVETIYRIPLADLGAGPEFVSIPQSDRPVVRYPLLGTTIHAPTAAVLYQFMEVAMHGHATRVAHLEQPVWAWR